LAETAPESPYSSIAFSGDAPEGKEIAFQV
jgi:hypothetical protein